jgi:AcrR family transcriptional regulator
MPSPLRIQRDQERTRRRREALLDAAGRVFVRHGYHRTLISDIAGEAKVGQGTFYRHFPEKRAIFEALFDRILELLFSEFQGMDARPPADVREYHDASAQAIGQVAQTLDRNRDLVRMLLREAPTVDPAMEARLAELNDGFVDIAQRFLDHAVASGFARPCRTRIVAQAIVGIGIAMADQWWRGRVPDLALQDLIEELIDFAFEGIGIPNRPEPGR